MIQKSTLFNPTQQMIVSQFQTRTYTWMCIGLCFTALVSLGVVQSEAITQFIFGNKPIVWGLLLIEFALVNFLSLKQSSLSFNSALLGFLVYSALNGITFTVFFLAYTPQAITQTFMLSAGMFAGLALFGSITQKDLTAVGSFFVMGIWGMILLSILNFFIGSESLHLGIATAGILIFSGLTAYDAQKIRNMAIYFSNNELHSESVKKASLYGALMMYLNFINLFLSLLQLIGKRRD